MSEHDLELYAKLMAESFLDDPGVSMQLAGIAKKLEVFETQCRCQVQAFSKLGGLTTLGHGDGILLGYFTGDEAQLSSCLQETSAYLMERVSTSDLLSLQQKAIEIMTEIARPDWYKTFLGEREVYVLQAIVVHPSLRGTGVFRRFITPILERAKQKGTPVVCQTHVFDHVMKYEQIGFTCMEKVVSDQMDLVCYNLLLNH